MANCSIYIINSRRALFSNGRNNFCIKHSICVFRLCRLRRGLATAHKIHFPFFQFHTQTVRLDHDYHKISPKSIVLNQNMPISSGIFISWLKLYHFAKHTYHIAWPNGENAFWLIFNRNWLQLFAFYQLVTRAICIDDDASKQCRLYSLESNAIQYLRNVHFFRFESRLVFTWSLMQNTGLNLQPWSAN